MIHIKRDTLIQIDTHIKHMGPPRVRGRVELQVMGLDGDQAFPLATGRYLLVTQLHQKPAPTTWSRIRDRIRAWWADLERAASELFSW